MEELMRLMVVGPPDQTTGEIEPIQLLRFAEEDDRGGQGVDLRQALIDYGESSGFIIAPDDLDAVLAAGRLREEVVSNPSMSASYADEAARLVRSDEWAMARQEVNDSLLAAKLVGTGGAPARQRLTQAFRDIALVEDLATNQALSADEITRLQSAPLRLPSQFARPRLSQQGSLDSLRAQGKLMREAARQALDERQGTLGEQREERTRFECAVNELRIAASAAAPVSSSTGDGPLVESTEATSFARPTSSLVQQLSPQTQALLGQHDLLSKPVMTAISDLKRYQASLGESVSAFNGRARRQVSGEVGGVFISGSLPVGQGGSSVSLPLLDDLEVDIEELELDHDVADWVQRFDPWGLGPIWFGPWTPGPSRIKPVGVGRLYIIRQQITGYEPGEVSHVENVLRGETRSRQHTRRIRSEQISIYERETETEEERSLQSTDRTELERETQQVLKEKFDVKGGVKLSGSYGMVSVEATAEVAYGSAREESARQAQKLVREVVETAKDRIMERVLERRERRMVHEIEEVNQHGFEAGDEHVIGVYQWLDKIYQAEIYSYGERLMYDLLIPEPASGLIAAATAPAAVVASGVQHPGTFEVTVAELTPERVNELVAEYSVTEVIPDYPSPRVISEGFGQSDESDPTKNFFGQTKNLTIPSGYYPTGGTIQVRARREGSTSDNDKAILGVTVGPISASFRLDNLHADEELHSKILMFDQLKDYSGDKLQIGCAADDFSAFVVTVTVKLAPSPAEIDRWKRQAFAAIRQAYNEKMQAWLDQEAIENFAAEEDGGPVGRNPARNREIEKRELQRQALELMRNRPFAFDHIIERPLSGRLFPTIDVDQLALDSPEIRFLQQAFEWENMTYLLYPYFYGRTGNWALQTLYDDIDPRWVEFLQAGAARVQIPVREGFRAAADHYMMTGEPWLGGDEPVIGDDTFLSFYEEERARLGGNAPEEHLEDQDFPIRVPTTLVKLRPSGDLPRWEKVDGQWRSTDTSD